jgi:hypothetical protein
MRNGNVIVCDNVGSLSRQATLQVERNSSVEVAFSLFDLGSLGLLIGVN